MNLKLASYLSVLRSGGIYAGISVKNIFNDNTTVFADTIYDRSERRDGARVPLARRDHVGEGVPRGAGRHRPATDRDEPAHEALAIAGDQAEQPVGREQLVLDDVADPPPPARPRRRVVDAGGILPQLSRRITSYNVCYTKLLRLEMT